MSVFSAAKRCMSPKERSQHIHHAFLHTISNASLKCQTQYKWKIYMFGAGCFRLHNRVDFYLTSPTKNNVLWVAQVLEVSSWTWLTEGLFFICNYKKKVAAVIISVQFPIQSFTNFPSTRGLCFLLTEFGWVFWYEFWHFLILSVVLLISEAYRRQ